MKVNAPKLPLPRDEAADYRISVFVNGDAATVKVRRQGDTEYHSVQREALFDLLNFLPELDAPSA